MKPRRLIVAIAAISLLISAGCSRIGGRTIGVEFRSAEGLRGGEAVYLAGVRVGTAHEPRLESGHAVVPVTIYRQHKDAVPAGTVFLLKRDPQDASRFALAGAVCSSGSPGQKPPETYQGVRNQIEFLAVCGAAKAAELYEELTR
ncbi:MAG: MlaD family protein [Bryobacteraceae bacterium]